MSTSEICTNERRRTRVRNSSSLTGIDYVEVSRDQLVLRVYFLGDAPQGITLQNVRIEGGRRVRNIKVVDVDPDPPEDAEFDPEFDDFITVTVDKAGDFSTYTLRLVEATGRDKQGNPLPLSGVDPRYAAIQFSFKAGCPSPLDCPTDSPCPPAPYEEPEINYLAKDYASFRQVILDRLAITLPGWNEQHVPDIGVTIVELMAYVGDYLSYYQDAVATEAYLDTARQRISVRRHTRLVDYRMHEGCNARTWVVINIDGGDLTDSMLLLKDVYFITGHNDALALSATMLTDGAVQTLSFGTYEVFEPLVADISPLTQPLQLYQAHNEIRFYTWDDTECCLPRGATSATLQDYPHDDNAEQEELQEELQQEEDREADSDDQVPPLQTNQPSATSTVPTDSGHVLHLNIGDILIFEEVKGAKTGIPADANPKRRHVVRLTSVTPGLDELSGKQIVDIEWAAEDALPFSFCISALGPALGGCQLIENISVARGNVLLVDHGQSIVGENTDPLQVPVALTTATCEGEDRPSDVEVLAGPFNPVLQKKPLTFSQPLPTEPVPAAQMLQQDVRQAMPWITLTGIPSETPLTASGTPSHKPRLWHPVYDLLESEALDTDFVVEIDNDGYAHLRFGDGELGRAPEPGEAFSATYRVGNGPSGNVGAESISRIVFRNTIISGVTLTPRNPFAAVGGTDQEPLAEVRLFAPKAFTTDLKRAITADDYATIAQEHAGVQRAAASLRWNGSFYDVQVAIDPFGTDEADQPLLDDVALYLEPYRRIGHDLKVVQAAYVPLDLSMQICVLPYYLRGHVEAALLDVFSNRQLPNGKLGFFHPDNLTFGQSIAVSTLIALAQAVPGVQSVLVDKLERFGEGPNDELKQGLLTIGPMEVAQLDNDPSFPEHGKLTFTLRGGR
ncbi:MAG: putative baseplate assembly protein [Ktedonobacteraceae bacterium]